MLNKFSSICALVLLSLVMVKSGFTQEDVFWSERKIDFPKQQELTPVLVAVWDTGVDLSTFKKQALWHNPSEKIDGTDTDGNGYVDDLHGIAFDLEEKPVPSQLMPRIDELSDEGLAELAIEFKGNRDFILGIQSEAAKTAIEKFRSYDKEGNSRAVRHLNWFGEYSHGTSMAQVCIKGNPVIRILPIRQQFSHSPPIPTVECYQRRAEAYAAAVQYMKDNSVRVANLSWSRWPKFFDKIVLDHKLFDSEEERKKLAEQLFEIERKALQTALSDAPEILFVVAAGNLGGTPRNGSIPQSLGLPNVISVGAADKKGDRVLTAQNTIVDVFAHGHNVIAKTVGGMEYRAMGTSVATAQVTNLASSLLAVNEKLTPAELKAIMVETSTPNEKDSATRLIHPIDAFEAAKRKARK